MQTVSIPDFLTPIHPSAFQREECALNAESVGVRSVSHANLHAPWNDIVVWTGCKRADDIRRELAFFRSNRRRMDYADTTAAGYAIGSGSVEIREQGCCSILHLMKCIGSRCHRDRWQWSPGSVPGEGPAFPLSPGKTR